MKTVFPAVSASKLSGVSSIALVLTAAKPNRASTFNMVGFVSWNYGSGCEQLTLGYRDFK